MIWQNSIHNNLTEVVLPDDPGLTTVKEFRLKLNGNDADSLVNQIDMALKPVYVSNLPTTDIKTNVIYCVLKSEANQSNGSKYDKWIYANNAWENLGGSYIDTSNFIMKNDSFIEGNLPIFSADGGIKESNTKPSDFLTEHQDISGKEDKSNKVTSISSSPTDTKYPTEKAVSDAVAAEASARQTALGNYYTKTESENKFVEKEEGKGLSANDYTTAEKNKLSGISDGAEVNVNADWDSTSGDSQILNKPTNLSDFTNDEDFQTETEVNEIVNTHNNAASAHNDIRQSVSTESNTRAVADTNLQSQIDAIVASSDVVDIVGTYADLQAYDKSKLHNNDIIKVLTDETQQNASSYYRYSTTTTSFTYIGSEAASYTKAEIDTKISAVTLNAGNGISIENKVVSANIDNDTIIFSANGELTVNGSLGGVQSINVGTTTTGEAGTQASVSKTGTEEDVILNFTIPRGYNGNSGVYVGTSEPEDENISVWIDSDGTTDSIEFNTLVNTPKYNGVNINSATNIPSVPTNTSQLVNDSNFSYQTTYVTISNGSNSADLLTNYTYTAGVLDDNALSITLNNSATVGYISQLTLLSGNNAVSFDYPDEIKWSGDEVSNGAFVPAANKHYTIIFWTDGLNDINAVVRGVDSN